jgi:ribosomal protein S18 acetylase RimI-like enzyme
VNYRLCQPDDFPQLYAIEELCFPPPDRFSRRYLRSLVHRVNAATWIMEEEGRLSGFAIVIWTQRKSEITAYIQTIEVVPVARHGGIGRALLQRIEASARAAGALLIWLHVEAANAAAVHLYETQGYHCQGRRENYYPEGRAALLYAKDLLATECSVQPPKSPQAPFEIPA